MTTRVLYNGACPICSREISAYERYAAKRDLNVGFEDLNASDLSEWGIDAVDAAKRIHVMHNGQVISGLPAFALVWDEMPKMRWLAWIVRLPVVRTILGLFYDHIQAPLLYALHRRRERKAGLASKG
ncbi:MAG: thiol-disulfide oxidoreductase DCC family protein [Planktomarina sp.]